MSCLSLNGKEELELRRQFLLRIKSIGKVDSPDPAVGMYLYSKRLYVVCTVGPTSEVREVKLDLVPAFVQPHRHRADKRLDSCGRLIIRCSKSSSHVFVVQHLHLKCEILLELVRAVTFFMIITKKGSFMPKVFLGSEGQVIKVVLTLVPMIQSTEDCMSWSVSRLMCPLRTCLSQICRGLLPMEQSMDKKPD